jgi:hypothetical protein
MRGVILVLCALFAVLALSSFAIAYHSPSWRTSYIQSDEFIISSANSYGGSYATPRMMYRSMPQHRASYFSKEPYPHYIASRRSGKTYYAAVETRDLYAGQRILYQPFPAACPYPLVAC